MTVFVVCVSFTIVVVGLTLHGIVVNHCATFINKPEHFLFILVLPFVIIVTSLVNVYVRVIHVSVYT